MILHTLNDSYDNLDEDLKEMFTFEEYKKLFAYWRAKVKKENEEIIEKYYANLSDSEKFNFRSSEEDSYSEDSYSEDSYSEEDIYNVLLFTRSKSVSSKSISKSKSRSKSVPLKSSSRFANNIILGTGAFGCVISKPISNKNYIIKEYIPYNDIDIHNNDIGKIYKKGDEDDEKSFNDELDMLLKIKKIDPFNFFTVKLKAASKFYGNIIAKDKHLLNILKVNNSIINETFFQIILENGGMHLDNFNNISYKKFLKLFEKFLQGMIKLNENKLVHGDIKPDNILINKTKINLIDFGHMLSAKNVYNKEYYGRLSAFYRFYPPEFFIASILLKCKNNISTKLDNVLDIMKKKEYFDKTNIPNKIHEFYYSGIKKFIKDIKSRHLTNYDDIFTEKLALQTDIYSLSLIIKEFINTKKIDYKTKKEYNFLLKIYKRCKNPNPYDRINIYSLYTLVYNEYNKQKI
jgi:serine/threonine protein kinase